MEKIKVKDLKSVTLSKSGLGKLYIYKDKKGEYRWTLKANNGKIVCASSEAFKSYSSLNHNLDLTFRMLKTFKSDKLF